MTRVQAEALIAGQKIQYWDGRIATVTKIATVPPPLPPPWTGFYPSEVPVIEIIFDAETANPKPICVVKVHDFMRAEAL